MNLHEIPREYTGPPKYFWVGRDAPCTDPANIHRADETSLVRSTGHHLCAAKTLQINDVVEVAYWCECDCNFGYPTRHYYASTDGRAICMRCVNGNCPQLGERE